MPSMIFAFLIFVFSISLFAQVESVDSSTRHSKRLLILQAEFSQDVASSAVFEKVKIVFIDKDWLQLNVAKNIVDTQKNTQDKISDDELENIYGFFLDQWL